MTRLLLRADASAEIGAGHVARTVAFAEQAVARGWAVSFSGRTDNADWLAARLDELGVHRVAPAPDAAALGELARDVDAVLVDHYGLGELRAEVNAAGAKLVSMEDDSYGRRAADVVVDCGFAPAARPDDGSPVLLRGPAYAPLRQAVRAARRQRAARPGYQGPPRVLVVLGGGGVWRDTVGEILRALRDTRLPFAARVLVRGEPEAPEPLPGQSFQVSPPGTNLPELLVHTDLAVSAAGVTLLELCCTGVPTAMIRLVDNQATGYRAALELGLAAGIGSPGELAGASGTLAGLLADPGAREKLARTASSEVDGAGVDRVLDALG